MLPKDTAKALLGCVALARAGSLAPKEPGETVVPRNPYQGGETCCDPLQKERARACKQRSTGLRYQPVKHLVQVLSEKLPLPASPAKMNATSSWSEVGAGGCSQDGQGLSVTCSSLKQLSIPRERQTSNNSGYGQYAEADTAISLAASQAITAGCLSVAGSQDLPGMEREEPEDKDAASSRHAQGRAGMSPSRTASPARQLPSERAGLGFVSYPSPFINQGKY